MKRIKKITSGLIAITLLSSSVMSLQANAAQGDSVQWNVSYSPHTSTYSIQYKSVNTYGLGYVAECTSIAGNGTANTTTITCNDSSYTLTPQVIFTVVGTSQEFNTFPAYAGSQVPLKISISIYPTTEWGSSAGTIRINN